MTQTQEKQHWEELKSFINQEYHIWWYQPRKNLISFYDWCKTNNFFNNGFLYKGINNTDEEEKAKIRQEVEDLVKEISDLA